jgi:methylated-DNA-protein-cysteine methyltransferase-like protein
MLKEIQAAVRRIPRGKVSTYGKVAEAAGFPGASRQVVWALRAPAAAVPWHRVVGAGGAIRLPGEHGLDQRIRLEAEGVGFRGSKVRMEDHEHDLTRRRTTKARSK